MLYLVNMVPSMTGQQGRCLGIYALQAVLLRYAEWYQSQYASHQSKVGYRIDQSKNAGGPTSMSKWMGGLL